MNYIFNTKNKEERSKAKHYLEEALEHYSKAISIATPQEVEKFELQMDLDFISPTDVYTARGDVYSWMNNKMKQACSDCRASIKQYDEKAPDNFRKFNVEIVNS